MRVLRNRTNWILVIVGEQRRHPSLNVIVGEQRRYPSLTVIFRQGMRVFRNRTNWILIVVGEQRRYRSLNVVVGEQRRYPSLNAIFRQGMRVFSNRTNWILIIVGRWQQKRHVSLNVILGERSLNVIIGEQKRCPSLNVSSLIIHERLLHVVGKGSPRVAYSRSTLLQVVVPAVLDSISRSPLKKTLFWHKCPASCNTTQNSIQADHHTIIW